MKGHKQVVIVCWIITAISLVAMITLHKELDIKAFEFVIQSPRIYDYDVRDFYKSIWGNIFTGALVSLLTSYASYWHAKGNVEFRLKSNEEQMIIEFGLIHTYWLSGRALNFNQFTIGLFKYTIDSLHKYYDCMIEASNDYAPFVKTKKVQTLKEGKTFLQEVWIEMVPLENDFLVGAEREAVAETMSKANSIVEENKSKLEEFRSRLKALDE